MQNPNFKKLGSVITYPFETSTIVLITDENSSLENGVQSSIINSSFVLRENEFDLSVACGSIKISDSTQAFVDFDGIDDNGISGQLMLEQDFTQDGIAISGNIDNFTKNINGLWVDIMQTPCDKIDMPLNMYKVSIYKHSLKIMHLMHVFIY